MRRLFLGLLAGTAALVWACDGHVVTGPGHGQGMLAAQLTDAPTPLDSVKEVNVFVERIDARRAPAVAADADVDLDHEHFENLDHPDSAVWVTIAAPNKAFNLLALQNGVTAFLGATPVDTGHFRAVRLIIDPTRSTVVLKDGTTFTATSTPPVEFERHGRQGLLVELNETVEVQESQTSTVVLDFRLGDSVTLRGRGVHDGFFFRPIVVGATDHGEHNGGH
jgi:hypothetical protein